MEMLSSESRISPLDPGWFDRAANYQSCLTMPTGALGRLLELGRQLCAVQETLTPRAEPAVVVVMAADHGVAEEGVSAYPPEVTSQMVANFLGGGAAINVLARLQGARLFVVDMGVRNPPAQGPVEPQSVYLRDLAVAAGTANFLHQAAMTAEQVESALAAGRRLVSEYLVPEATRVVALGEMGIGNTTSASALTAALTGMPAASVTGRGTGLDDARLRHKIAVIERALARHFPGRTSTRQQSRDREGEANAEPPLTHVRGSESRGAVQPLEALQAVGGFEIAGLVGVALEAAARRMLILLDGFISSVAGLLAVRMEPATRGYLVASHRSVEAGHRAVLEALDLAPLLDLGLRLGEGSGAALAINLVQCSANIMREMATFDAAGVSTQTK